MVISALGVSVVPTADDKGVQIRDVARSGAMAGLHPGDVINSLNGSQIRTPMELANVLSGLPFGSQVKLGVLTRGMWQTETTLLLSNR
jgi:S1-C subfamily serine protease